MTDTEQEPIAVPPEEPTPKPVDPPPDVAPEEEPPLTDADNARARQCYAAIQEMLAQYHCYIVPVLTSQQVGNGPPTSVMMTASYGVMPEVMQ